MAGPLPRMNLNLRVQHGLLVLCVVTAIATGLLREGGHGAEAVRWHLIAGFGALALLFYHLLYLVVRGYVESRGWGTFPLRWERADWTLAAAEARFLFGRAPERPEAGEHRAGQKAFYWWTGISLAVVCASGVAVEYWERFGAGLIARLPALAAAHRGFALLLLATALWHLYGALTWAGRWMPDLSWASGLLAPDLASRKVPGAWRRHLAAEAELASAPREAEPEERRRERLEREKQEVESALEAGNRLALEERYVEALYHYRRALELYPGYSQARYNMARVLARMGENQMAVEAYRLFLEHDPFHPLARKAQEAVRELQEGKQP